MNDFIDLIMGLLNAFLKLNFGFFSLGSLVNFVVAFSIAWLLLKGTGKSGFNRKKGG